MGSTFSGVLWFQEIGTTLPRPLDHLASSPLVDGLVVAGEQHVGDGPVVPDPGPRVVGVFKQSPFETFVEESFHHFFGQFRGYKPCWIFRQI